jgi:phospholipase C
VPGPTMVNRAYAASATSHGMGTNDEKTIAKGLPQTTMFKQLLDMGLDYRVYFKDVPSVLQHKDMRRKAARERYHMFDKFFTDLDEGTIPEFTWLEPGYFSTPHQQASDQHPDHDVGQGEQLVKDVYEALRASSIWEESLLVITYDEHGGFFDHVAPPYINVPNPDGLNSTDDPFDFTRLGVRVPSLLISPWVKKGTVIHREPNGEAQYEHSSIVNTVVHKLFKAAPGHRAPEYLTKRDQWSKTFEWIVDTEQELRTDCPDRLPPVYMQQQQRGNGSVVPFPLQDGSLRLTALQKELVLLVAGATEDVRYDREITAASVARWTEVEGAKYVQTRMELFLNSGDI